MSETPAPPSADPTLDLSVWVGDDVLERAKDLIKRKKPKEAISWLRSEPATATDPRALLLLGVAYEHSGQPMIAIEIYSAAQAAFTRWASIAATDAAVCHGLGHSYRAALERASEAINLDRSNWMAWINWICALHSMQPNSIETVIRQVLDRLEGGWPKWRESRVFVLRLQSDPVLGEVGRRIADEA